MRVSAWKSCLPPIAGVPMRIGIAIVGFDQDLWLALTGFVITSANFRVIRYPTDPGQTQSQDQPKGLRFDLGPSPGPGLIDAPPGLPALAV